MKTYFLTLLVMFSSSLISASNLVATTQADLHPVVQQLTPSPAQVVTIVKVKAPWYAFDFLLKYLFVKAIPDYQKVDGLRFKAFSSIETDKGKLYGGIYLWDSEKQARSWYSPKWFAEVERKRNQTPNVDYYPVVETAVFTGSDYNYRNNESQSVTLFLHDINAQIKQESFIQRTGLLRSYLVQETEKGQGVFLLFTTAEEATRFLKEKNIKRYEWFKTPVLLNNTH